MAGDLANRMLGFKYDMVAPSNPPHVANRACNSASWLFCNECMNRDTVRRLARYAIYLRGWAFWENRMRKYTYLYSMRHFGKYQHGHYESGILFSISTFCSSICLLGSTGTTRRGVQKLIQAPTRWTASTGSFRGHHYSPHLVDAERRRALPGASFWEESALLIWARLSRWSLESFSVASRLVRRVASLTRRVYLSSRRL